MTNWSSRGTRGPGMAYTIMARPRTWERGEGTVQGLTPRHAMLTGVRAKTVSVASYRDDFVRHAKARPPGALRAWTGTAEVEVGNGDTLCCGCSKAVALEGKCHRVWAAELLRREGWEIVLDGKVLVGVDSEWRPILGAEVRADG